MTSAQFMFRNIVCISLAVSMVVGCAEQNTSNSPSDTQSDTQEISTQGTTDESAPRAGSGATASSLTLMSGTAQTTGLTGQNVACDTPEHFTEIVWQEGQPRITFAKKPDETTLNESYPVTIATNTDGSRTYGYDSDITVYSRFYLDGSCLIQALDDQGNSTVEAFGRTVQVGAISGVNIPLEPEVSAIAAEPNVDDALTLVCSGTIQDEVDFTVYFDRQSQSGFNRAELRPRTSNDVLTTTLTYKTRSAKGEGIWQGAVNETTDVTLVHLSRSIPQVGDEVSVGYGGQWGRAVCQEG